MDKHRAWATGDLPLTLSKSTHMHKARREEADWGVRLLLSNPPPPSLDRMQRAQNQERSPGFTRHSWSLFPGQEG